jgi:CBS domain-containing protein
MVMTNGRITMLVSQILKTKSDDGVVTQPPGTTVAQIAEVLSSRRIGAVVISVNGKTVAGIVSERDIVREIGRHGASCLGQLVDQIMTQRVVTCAKSDRADDVLQKMTDGRFRHIPVDVVKARLAELAMENDALEGMIRGV